MTDTAHPFGLGRIFVPDARDWDTERLHRELAPPTLSIATIEEVIDWVRDHLGLGSPPRPSDVAWWTDPVVLDQGAFGTCVGNGWAGWGDSAPVEDSFNETDARAIYYEATVIDGTPDDPNAPGGGQRGTSVRAGAQAMQNRKRLSAYAFARSLADVDEWLLNHGPVVFGTQWTEGMFNPDPDGTVHPTGPVAGGHAWLVIGKDTDHYAAVNSWGTGWGKSGHFFVRSADLASLLADQGEACLAAELPLS